MTTSTSCSHKIFQVFDLTLFVILAVVIVNLGYRYGNCLIMCIGGRGSLLCPEQSCRNLRYSIVCACVCMFETSHIFMTGEFVCVDVCWNTAKEVEHTLRGLEAIILVIIVVVVAAIVIYYCCCYCYGYYCYCCYIAIMITTSSTISNNEHVLEFVQ